MGWTRPPVGEIQEEAHNKTKKKLKEKRKKQRRKRPNCYCHGYSLSRHPSITTATVGLRIHQRDSKPVGHVLPVESFEGKKILQINNNSRQNTQQNTATLLP